MFGPNRTQLLVAFLACFAVIAPVVAASAALASPAPASSSALTSSVDGYRWPGDTLLTAYVSEALLLHPDLARQDAMVLEAEAERSRASEWMNPVLSFGIMDAPTDFRLGEDPMTQQQVGISQTVPWFTKPVYSRRAAVSRLEAARRYADAERWAIRARVAAGYFHLAGLLTRAVNLEEALTIAGETVSAAAIAVGSGMDSRAILLKAEIERGRISQEVVSLNGEIEKARWELAEAIGRPDAASLADPAPLPATVHMPELDWASPVLEESPSIAAMKSDSVSSYWEWRRARLEYLPDVMLGFKYGFRRGSQEQAAPDLDGAGMSGAGGLDDRVSVEVSAPIPLWGRGSQKAAVIERKAGLEKAAAELRGGRLRSLSQARSLHAEAGALASQYRLVSDTLLAHAEDAMKSELSEYEAGRSTRAGVNDVRMSLTALRTEKALLAVEFFVKKAELEAVIGRIL